MQEGQLATDEIGGHPAMGVATVADPTYLEGRLHRLSLTLGGYLRVVVAGALAAGSAIIGKVGIDQTAGQNEVVVDASARAGGVNSTSRLLSAAATTNATSVKASAGRLYAIHGYNASAATVYLKLYNKASAPTVGSDTPVKTIAIPALTAFDLSPWAGVGYSFATGIAYALTGAGADADTTALAAGDIICLNLDYA